MMITHFSHHHPLSPYQVELDHHDHHQKHDDQDHDHDHDHDDQITICSGCELELISGSSAYKCNKPGCDFRLHELCSELPRESRHPSHPQHPLTLLFTPHYSFTCKACAGSGTAFIYSCTACRFDLHVSCIALAESVRRVDHEHPLELVFSSKEEECCGICGCSFVEGCWAYLCRGCGSYGTHLECATSEEEEEKELLVGSGENEEERGIPGSR
ncbi:hypothetical protein L484_010161 [Morus notabilis]|uniref:DC1 domain-containing protein n=1 Tax=Morus notabilis TaxID=981085 RepID=W9RJZ4_9ROSA|nr:uncharacterized protein LOC21393465 [Morus notabilis]EXB77335.1 hypothetical protein L484_010161 [Morus notabilis]